MKPIKLLAGIFIAMIIASAGTAGTLYNLSSTVVQYHSLNQLPADDDNTDYVEGDEAALAYCVWMDDKPIPTLQNAYNYIFTIGNKDQIYSSYYEKGFINNISRYISYDPFCLIGLRGFLDGYERVTLQSLQSLSPNSTVQDVNSCWYHSFLAGGQQIMDQSTCFVDYPSKGDLVYFGVSGAKVIANFSPESKASVIHINSDGGTGCFIDPATQKTIIPTNKNPIVIGTNSFIQIDYSKITSPVTIDFDYFNDEICFYNIDMTLSCSNNNPSVSLDPIWANAFKQNVSDMKVDANQPVNGDFCMSYLP